jgi:multidrug resistance efflux pump
MEGHDAPIETPRPQRIADFKRRQLPLVVWSVAALACVWLLFGRATRIQYLGLARAMQYEVSAQTAGRLETLLVDVYDRVQAGDIVAKLDDSEIAAQIGRSRASIRRLGAELEAARTQLAVDKRIDRAGWHSDLRRFETDVEDRRLEMLALRVTIESDEVEAERLGLEVQRSGPLLEVGLIGQAEYESLRLQRDTVQKRVDESRILLAQTDSEFRMAQARLEAFEREMPVVAEEEPLLRPLREAIDEEQHVLEEIQSRRNATVLRSPVDGQVSSVFCRKGQSIVPGEPILTIADSQVTEIVAYLDEADSARIRDRVPVRVASLSRPASMAESIVLRHGPDVEMLPQRLWREPSVPEYGRAVVIASVPGLGLTPGELLSVKILDER